MSIESATPDLPPAQPAQPYFHVSALEAGFLHIPTWQIVADANKDEILKVPSMAFFLRHSETGKQLLFDVGIRRECERPDPLVVVRQTAGESLKEGGIDPEEIDTVILSHLHWDHVGKASEYPNATFIVGPGCAHLVHEHHPEMYVLPRSIPPTRTRILDKSTSFPVSIGPFPQAQDFFGDGSLYIVNAEGHLQGHANVLARTSADGSWIYLGGDTAHDVRILTGEKAMTYSHDKSGHVICAHEHKEDALDHIKRVQSLLVAPRVHVLLAHDWEWYDQNRDSGAFLPGKIPAKVESP